jgi:hypothetical protein
MPWIQHFSRSDIQNGDHYAPVDNAVLIQIKDVDAHATFVKPKLTFGETYQFSFEDTEDETNQHCISDLDATQIAEILRNAYANQQNVIVHCLAGLCRSSAVAVAGAEIGFHLPDKVRMPNALVKKKVFQKLGLYFDPAESPFKTMPDPYGIMTDNEN